MSQSRTISNTAFGSSITEMTYANDTAKGYRYGFNNQEKDDEISGDGNSYTAEYWEYDSRLGRRWNIDPVLKPFISNYSAFNNCPIAIIDPFGDDIYLSSTTGEKTTEQGEGKDVRLISDAEYKSAKEEFISDKVLEYKASNPNATSEQINDYKLLTAPGLFGLQGKSYLDKYSKIVSFESLETQTEFISRMEAKSEGETNEQDLETGGFIVIDLDNAKAKMIESTAERNRYSTTKTNMYHSEAKPKIKFADEKRRNLIIGSWHTHPQTGSSFDSHGPSKPGHTADANGGNDVATAKSDNLTEFIFDINIYVVERSGDIQAQSYKKGSYNVIEQAWNLYIK